VPENISGMRSTSETVHLEREAVLRQGRYLVKQIELATSDGREMPERELATLFGKLDGVLDALAEATAPDEEPAPRLCSQCLRFLTMTAEQLEEYIVLIAKQATRVSWPQEIAERKLRSVMQCGDRVEWVGYGALTVRRTNGEMFSVYQRDS